MTTFQPVNRLCHQSSRYYFPSCTTTRVYVEGSDGGTDETSVLGPTGSFLQPTVCVLPSTTRGYTYERPPVIILCVFRGARHRRGYPSRYKDKGSGHTHRKRWKRSRPQMSREWVSSINTCCPSKIDQIRLSLTYTESVFITSVLLHQSFLCGSGVPFQSGLYGGCNLILNSLGKMS